VNPFIVDDPGKALVERSAIGLIPFPLLAVLVTAEEERRR
jgi:hypothetical protein